MSRSLRVVLQLSLAASMTVALCLGVDRQGFHASAARAAPTEPGVCALPTAVSATAEETAWRLFVAANCPSNRGKVVWESWIEQNDLYVANAGAAAAPAVKTKHRLHGSPLAQMLAAKARGEKLLFLVPSTNCGRMRGAPPNVVAKTICEETHLNPDAAEFVTGHGYQVRAGQIKAAQAGVDIEFTKPSVEVKVDWIPATDFKPAFSCASPPAGIHVEVVDGVCYVMAGMHISSKLLDKWIWATFEPQSMLTNPLRCITFGSCQDAWGSAPATSSGGTAGFTSQTPAVQQLMMQANLAPEFANYRLDGVQTDFSTPTFLGNSIIEGENVGMRRDTVSCISCHSESSIKTDGTDGSPNALWGQQFHPPTGWIARDFVWSLSLAP